MRYLKVLDKQQNVKKLLVIFDSKQIFEQDLKILKDIFTSSLRSDLILNLYDSYFLDPEGTFFVFETECYDLNSEVLSEKCNISPNQIEKIMKKQLNYIFYLLGIKKQVSELSAPIYVNLLNENQISVKLNLFDFYEQIQSLIIEKPNYYIQNTNTYLENNDKILQQVIIDEKVISIINKQLFDYEQNALLPLKKQQLLQKLLTTYSKDLQSHGFRIFEIISENPQYNNFEILSINKNPFEFKLTKRNKNILLIGIKFNTISEALTSEKEYKKFHLIQGKFKSNLIDTYTFQLENCCYLLLEYEQNSQDNEQFQSLAKLILKKKDDCDEYGNKDKLAFDCLQRLIEISYELQINYNIKIINIDPDKIFVQQQAIQQGFDVYLIDRHRFKNYKSEYVKLISKIFEDLNFNYKESITFTSNGYNPDFNHYYLITSFLEMVSNATIENKNEIQNSYQNITKMLQLLAYVIEQNQTNENFQLKISENDPYKLSIKLSNCYYDETKEETLKQLKSTFAFLIKNQEIIQKIQFKTNSIYSQILNYQNQQNQLFQQNKYQSLFSSSQFQQKNQSQQESSVLLDKTILEEIGLINTRGYNSQNIGLSICQNLQNLQILSLEFSEGFNFNVVNQDSNFLRLCEQIMSLELNFKSNDDNIFNLIFQLQQYKNLNTLRITLNKRYNHIKKLEKFIKKIQRLVLISIHKDWIPIRPAKTDNNLGFFF
ncbi:hypothetical protein ABPG72_015594 [Tetrahymena utriculariae]